MKSPLAAQEIGEQQISIGVLSHRGFEATLETWTPTANYLSRQLSDYQFKIIPLDFSEVEPALKNEEVDFLLVNSGIYVNMEVKYRISRIATLKNIVGNTSNNVFGGVVFSHAKHPDIHEFKDIRGSNVMAVDETSLGGFQMAWREWKGIGIDTYKDFGELSFAGSHDPVVMAVKNGIVDVGVVRTGILEQLAQKGTIDLEDFQILNARTEDDFKFLHSTRLYPEWPFSKLHHTANALAQKVAIALLTLPFDHHAAMAGGYEGWTVPLDYQPVHELLRALNLAPYDQRSSYTLIDAAIKYRYWVAFILMLVVILAFMTAWVMRLNKRLNYSKTRLETQYDLILGSVGDGIYGVDKEGNSTFVNRAMEEITGWKASELIGFNQHEMLHHTKKDGSPHYAHDCPVYKTYGDNKARFVSDDVFWRKDGTSFPVEYSATPIRNLEGGAMGSVVVFRDISSRHHAEEEARSHQMELAHVARLSTMGEMASGIAHEINQPLTAIATNAHAGIRLLESKGDVEKVEDLLERIASQAEMAGNIIQQLRSFVKKEPLGRSFVSVNQLIEDVIVLIDPEARKSQVSIVRHLVAQLPEVKVQPIQIDQVILNLARNAIEAISESEENTRRLVFITEFSETDIKVIVKDTGDGIDPALIDSLLNPFVTTKEQGMGLGLSISQGIVEAHGGRLSFESWEEGTLFYFTLPLKLTENKK